MEEEEDLFSDWSVQPQTQTQWETHTTYAQSNVEATQNIQHDLKEQKSAWQQQQQPAWQQQQQPAWQQQLFFKSNEKNK